MRSNDGFDDAMRSLRDALSEAMPSAGRLNLPVPGLLVIRNETGDRIEDSLMRPRIGLIVQGFARVYFGEEAFDCAEGRLLVCGVDMPGVYRDTEATPESPMLAMALDIDVPLLCRYFHELPKPAPRPDKSSDCALLRTDISVEMLDAFARLVRVSTTEHAATLAPLIIQEIHYRLACSPAGDFLRRFLVNDGPCRRIAQVLGYIREHIYERLSIETLSEKVGMAESTFNRNFKKVTCFSPLQYHKQMKLSEARRLMSQEGRSSAEVCTAVGYESQQQFTREYKRLFGHPPMRDVRKRTVRG